MTDIDTIRVSDIITSSEDTTARLTDMASKFDKYVLNNTKIDEGPPVRYKLPLREENLETGNLRRLSSGKEDPTKQNKTILLLGETGSGKSTLVNTICNYVMGVKFEDRRWFEIVDDKDTGKHTESKTAGVTVYEIFGFEGETVPYSVTIIDTPGYGDTKGIQHDITIHETLHELFRSEKGIHEIHVVGLVVKASENRLSGRLRYIFDSVVSLFGKDMEENIIALITHSDGMSPKNALQALQDANIKCAKNEKNQPVHFSFNNCQTTEITEENEFALEYTWRVTMRGLEKFFAFLVKTTPRKLETTVNVLTDRIRLAACINNLTDRIEMIKLKQREIEQTQEGLKEHEKDMEKVEKVTVEVDEPYKDKEPIDGGMFLFWYGGAVTCTACQENCHHPGCTLAWYPSHCKVMKDGHCTSCTNKCPASKHVKEKMKYVTKTRKVPKIIEVKPKHEEGKKEQFEKILLEYVKEKEKLENEVTTCTEEIYECVKQLEQMALNDNSLFTYIHLDLLIKVMEDKGDREKVLKLKDMASRVDEGMLEALRFRFGNVVGKLPALAKAAGKKLGRK